MAEANFLFTHLSVEEVIVLVIVMVLAIKSVWSAAEWIWKKIRDRLDITNDKDRWDYIEQYFLGQFVINSNG